MLTRLPLLLIAVLAHLTGSALAGDWPQILGPNRDGVAVGEQLIPWPKSGPARQWTLDIGQGFAGVAVRDDVVYLFHREGDEEVVSAIDAKSGQKIWSRGFPCRYQSGISSDAGPRCVPVVSDSQVFVYGVEGQLHCVNRKTGEGIWSRNTWKDFSAPEGYFGAGSTPLLVDDRLIVNVGGRDGAAVVAFSAVDGTTLWQSFEDSASYSSPILADVDGVKQAIAVTRFHVVSLNPDDGAVRFSFPFGARGPTVNGATPIVMEDQLFVSASYRVGSVWAAIGAEDKAQESTGERLLATQYATPVPHKGLLFAVDGRQDMGTATLKCIDPARGKVLWSEGGFDYGTLIRANEDLLFLTCGGELIRFAADSSAYRETQRSQVLQATPRGYRLPALSNGRFFARDDSQLKCVVVGKSAE